MNLKNLSFLVVFLPFLCSGQKPENNALSRAQALYLAKKTDLAQLVIDTAITKPDTKNNPITWTTRAYIYFELFKRNDRMKLYSPLRDTCVSSLFRSNNLKPDENYTENNRKLFTSIAHGYWNLATTYLKDSTSAKNSMVAYSKYKEVSVLANSQDYFKKRDEEFVNAVAAAFDDINNERAGLKKETKEKQDLLDLASAKNAIAQMKVEMQQNDIAMLNKEKALQEAMLQKQVAETKKQEMELTHQRRVRNISFASIGLLFIVLFLIYRNLSLNKKQNKIILAQKREVEIQKKITEDQKRLVEEKQRETQDSINYARRIQYALLASDNLLNEHLPDRFVFFKPKDVVSGDFYWAAATPEGFLYITADCTGHGVPGAFMSLLNIGKLSQTVNENKITRPDLILNNVRSEIIKALNPEGSSNVSKDGMDAILCKLNVKNMTLEYAAGNNSFYIMRGKEVLQCKADKMPVGKGHDDTISFTYNQVQLQKGDVIYTFTDGLPDQFGGENGKKFMSKNLRELLIKLSPLPMPEQKQLLETTFKNWIGNLEQVDDITIIGVRI